MEYFKKKRDFGFELVIFTCAESLEDYLLKHVVDILLLGENTQPQEYKSDNIRHIFRLADKTGVYQENGYTVINKYQMVQAIISDIKADYVRHESEAGNSKPDSVKVVSIFSPVQDLDTLSFAWSAGLLLSEQTRTLLVLLELLPVQVISTTDYSNQPLTELIYYIKENMDINARLKSLVCYQGSLAYVSGIANGADILALSKEDILRWVTVLKTQSEYDEIIFYVCSNSEAAQELINISDTVLFSFKDSLYANSLYKEWAAQLERTGVSLLQNKFIRLTLPEETVINRLPVTALELTGTDCWDYAKQQLDKFR
jgi:hypothetical protein